MRRVIWPCFHFCYSCVYTRAHTHTHTHICDLFLPELCLFFPELGNEETNGVRITVFFCIVSQTARVKSLHQLTFALRQGGLRQPTTTQVGILKHASPLLQGGSPPKWGLWNTHHHWSTNCETETHQQRWVTAYSLHLTDWCQEKCFTCCSWVMSGKVHLGLHVAPVMGKVCQGLPVVPEWCQERCVRAYLLIQSDVRKGVSGLTCCSRVMSGKVSGFSCCSRVMSGKVCQHLPVDPEWCQERCVRTYLLFQSNVQERWVRTYLLLQSDVRKGVQQPGYLIFILLHSHSTSAVHQHTAWP